MADNYRVASKSRSLDIHKPNAQAYDSACLSFQIIPFSPSSLHATFAIRNAEIQFIDVDRCCCGRALFTEATAF